jgi:hypothetical protein
MFGFGKALDVAAELERQRPVVEAARAWRSKRAADILNHAVNELPEDKHLVAAVDAFGDTAPPESTMVDPATGTVGWYPIACGHRADPPFAQGSTDA